MPLIANGLLIDRGRLKFSRFLFSARSHSSTFFFRANSFKMAGGKKLTKEDEILLQNFSRTVSTKSSALFYANAFFVSAIPLCKYICSTLYFSVEIITCVRCFVRQTHVFFQWFTVSGLFWRIHQMDPYSSGIMFVVMTLISTWLVAFAYKNVKFQLKHK